ncbi:thermonuclease family protein [Pimelobacter simplex]|uniref:thermonuclease family protein n=1 Tax=Nocardioides simplex TaxID=2045 RepID=UPI001931E6DB|nr:thermonuclease family protein [Pimelobacter simplex]
MKALIGLAAAAIVALTAGGIKAALPGARTGPEPSDGTTTQVRVTAVVDGDTIRVETLGGRQLGRVRILGIDAPEVAHPLEPAECYAEDATRLLEQLAPVGSTVDLVTDTQPNRDRYDRLLRYVDRSTNTGDVDVASAPLASGAARRYEVGPALAREESYSTAVDDAQGARRGLWGSC